MDMTKAMRTLQKIALWLAFIFTCLLPASALTLTTPESRVWDFFNVGYDAVGRANSGYDVAEKSSTAYDVAPSRAQTDNERRIGAQRTSFALFGRLLAAKTATNPLQLEFKFASEFTAPAKRATGETVLGHYPAYNTLAEETGARYYNIPSEVWNKMTPEQAWTANVKFLDRTMSRGDSIRLATPLDQVKPGSYFERELNYLFEKGYVPNGAGTHLVPGG